MSKVQSDSTTATPPCPPWCTGTHDVGQTRPGSGQPEALVRFHGSDSIGDAAWAERGDMLLPDGRWIVGDVTISTSDAALHNATAAEAMGLARRLMELAATA